MSPSPQPAEKPSWHFALLIAIPALLLWGIFSFSPNFDFYNPSNPKGYPLGGDYLQEFVGGRICTSNISPYNTSWFRNQQHDFSVVGFEWDDKQYFPPVYPPFWYAAVSPLSQLDYSVAAYLWAALMTTCLIASLALIHRYIDTPLLLLLLLCLSTPVIHSISSGQKGTLLLLIFTISFLLLKKLQPVKSGAVFALTLFKPYLGICVGLLMLNQGKWRWVASTLLTVAAIVAVSWLTMPQLCRDYIDVCRGFGDYVQSGGYDLAKSYSLWSGWQMLIPHSMTAKLLTGITALAALIGSLHFLRKLPRHKPESFETAFAVMMLVTAITAPHFYYYDLTMLILPAAIFASQTTREKFSRVQWAPVLLIAAAMFGSALIEQVGLATNVALGPILLIAAIVSALRRSTA